MADLTIVEAKTPVATPTGRAFWRGAVTETGWESIGRAWERLGVNIFGLGRQMYELDAEAELTQKMLENNERAQTLFMELSKETNPDEHLRKYEEFAESVKSVEFRNGLARQNYQRTLPVYLKGMGNAAFQSYRRRINENHDMAVANITALYVQGKASETVLLKTLRSREGITKDEVNYFLETAKRDRKDFIRLQNNREMENVAGTNPAEMYKATTAAIQSGVLPKTILGVSTQELTIGHMREYRNVAIGDLKALTAQEKERDNKIIKRMHALAWELTRASDVHRELTETVQDPEKRTEYLDEYFDALKIRLQVEEAPESKDFEKTAAVTKVLYPMIEDIFAWEAGEETPERTRVYMKEYGRRLLEDAIAREELTHEREIREKAVRIALNIEHMLKAGEFEQIRPEALPKRRKTQKETAEQIAADLERIPLSEIKRLSKKPLTARQHNWAQQRGIQLLAPGAVPYVPKGLESIWDRLNDTMKQQALTLLKRGMTAEELVQYFNNNPEKFGVTK